MYLAPLLPKRTAGSQTGDIKRERGKKHGPFLSSALPPLFPIWADIDVHISFSWLLCLSRLTRSFVFTNPFSCARSIFLVFFSFNTCEYFLPRCPYSHIPYPPTSLLLLPSLSHPPTQHFSHYLPLSLLINQQLPIGKFMRLIIFTWVGGFTKRVPLLSSVPAPTRRCTHHPHPCR